MRRDVVDTVWSQNPDTLPQQQCERGRREGDFPVSLEIYYFAPSTDMILALLLRCGSHGIYEVEKDHRERRFPARASG